MLRRWILVDFITHKEKRDFNIATDLFYDFRPQTHSQGGHEALIKILIQGLIVSFDVIVVS